MSKWGSLKSRGSLRGPGDSGSYPTTVVHGATGSTARPSGSIQVLWVGTATPANAATDDLWWDSTNLIVKHYTGAAWDSSGSRSYGAVRTVGAGNTIVGIGDSIMALAGTTPQMSDGWWTRLCVRSMGRLKWAGTVAAGGYTFGQALTNLLPSVLAMSPLPSFAVLALGTDDCGTNSGGGAGTGFVPATSLANMTSMVTQLQAAGIQPILTRVPARGDVTLATQNIALWNRMVVGFAQQYGLPVWDLNTPLLNAATGGMLATYTSDQVHPNALGGAAIAEYLLASGAVSALYPPSSFSVAALGAPNNGTFTSKYQGDPYNLADYGTGRGLFLANAAGIGTGWGKHAGTGTARTYSVVAPVAADNIQGNWQVMTSPVGATSSEWLFMGVNATATKLTPLHTYEFVARIRASGYTADPGSQFMLNIRDTGTNVTSGIYLWTQDVADGLISVTYTTPASVGVSDFFFEDVAPAGGVANQHVLQMAEVTLRDLTAMGVASL